MTTKYSEDHEWISVDGAIGKVGITNNAQSLLGDIVFIELPEVGRTIEAGGEAGVIESVKAASDLFSPVTGKIIEINEALDSKPSLANSDPSGNGWFFKIKLSDTDELDSLMDEASYKELIAE